MRRWRDHFCLVVLAALVIPVGAADETRCGLRVETEPAGATVVCDGAERGVAPVTIEDLDPGEHLVVARRAGCEEQRKTVSIDVGGVASVKLQLPALMGLVLIRSKPAGADVVAENITLGKTPLFVDDLSLGKHHLTFQLTGFSERTIDLDLKDRTPVQVMAELMSDSATLNVESTPPGAKITVNGIDKGVAPAVLDGIASGETKIDVMVDGYEPYSRTLKLSAGQSEDITVNLNPMPATLKIVSIPTKARIYIENQFSGEAPLEKKGLPVGSVRVRAESPGYRPMARTVKLEKGADVTEEFRLEKDTGVLLVTTKPYGAEIRVDGQAMGVTERDHDAQAGGLSRALRIEVTAGETHRIMVTKKGHVEDDQSVTLESGMTNEIRSILKRDFVIDCEVETTYGKTIDGALTKKNADGSVKIETSPNKFMTIPAAEIKSMTRPGVEDAP